MARSFVLSLRFLPARLREHFARAYLLARAGDTVADTEAVDPAARERMLAQLEAAARRLARGEPIALEAAPLGSGGLVEERTLLAQLPMVAGWVNELEVPARKRAGEVCTILFAAMRRDLARFGINSDRVVALPDPSSLDTYLYGNAGCVGGYWAQELATTSHRFTGLDVQSLEQSGVYLGKALQRVNVLRDLAKDLRRGRCYLPANELADHGLDPRDLYFPDAMKRLKPLLGGHLEAAQADLEKGLEFFHHLPYHWIRQRAAAGLPAVLARRTLDRLAAEPHRILDAHDTIKVPRPEVKRLIARFLLLPPTDRGLERLVMGRRGAPR
ncbi:phytoene/squalene synthase family protein [Thiohalorhabdus sp.]|uniref:phytoene/squalene synthase family protein n=1 Tax=Thiohalorhabdus sp. TaxID=3094134 RepID=UPI002FC2A2E2